MSSKVLWFGLFLSFTLTSLGAHAEGEIRPSHLVNYLRGYGVAGEDGEIVLHGYNDEGEACDLVAKSQSLDGSNDDDAIVSEFYLRPTDRKKFDCHDVNEPKSKCRSTGVPDRVYVEDHAGRLEITLKPDFPDINANEYLEKGPGGHPKAFVFPFNAKFPEYPRVACYFLGLSS